jgi:hypothetical protein
MPHAWAAWVAAGGLVAATGVAGALALATSAELKREPYPTSDSATRLNSLSQRVTGLAISTDVLGAAAAASLGIALFVTLRKVETSAHNATAKQADLSLRLTPEAIALARRF